MVPHYLRCTVRDPFAKFWHTSYDILILVLVALALMICYIAQTDSVAEWFIWDFRGVIQNNGPFNGYSKMMFCWVMHRPRKLFNDSYWTEEEQIVPLEYLLLYGPVLIGMLHSMWAFWLAQQSLNQGFAFSGGTRLRILTFMRRFITGQTLFWGISCGVTVIAYSAPQDDCLNHSCIQVFSLLLVFRAVLHLLLWFGHYPYGFDPIGWLLRALKLEDSFTQHEGYDQYAELNNSTTAREERELKIYKTPKP